MLNRNLLRAKIVQLVYANYKRGGQPLDAALKELKFSIEQAYELYFYLLMLIVDVTDYARLRHEVLTDWQLKHNPYEKKLERFINNRFVDQLEHNEQFIRFTEKPSIHHWTEAEATIKNLYTLITTSELCHTYVEDDADDYAHDRSFWIKAYKKFIFHNEEIEAVLEEWNIYWNDDKEIIDTFVQKTIKLFEQANGGKQPLLPAYSEEESSDFAVTIFENALSNFDAYEELIRKHVSEDWDYKRVAPMDVVIMICAIAELCSLPSVAVNVTLNEYINLAKTYSTPKSAAFVNGILDKVVQQLREEGKILK